MERSLLGDNTIEEQEDAAAATPGSVPVALLNPSLSYPARERSRISSSNRS